MRRSEHVKRFLRQAISGLGLSLMIAACAPPVGEQDPHARFPIVAEKATFVVSLNFERHGEAIVAENEAVFQKFVREFQRRGRSRLIVSTSAETTPDDERALAERLAAEGVRPGSIGLRRGKAEGREGKAAVFSFRGYLVKVPECDNWKGETGFNPTNLPHANYGCAYQRNIGLMLSDPGDLVTSKGVVEMDARRVDNTIRVHREGTAAGADPPKNEQGKFAAPGQE